MESNPWEKHWGMKYDGESKREYLTPIFSSLESEGKIGEVVLDIGSGYKSVAEHMPGQHKIISLDIAGDESETFNRTQIKFDITKASDEGSMSYKKALVKAAKFIDVDLRQERDRQQIDAVVFSEILNYVDYQRAIHAFNSYLKNDGRLIIVNMPTRGFKNLFVEKGLKSNVELYEFLEQEGFEIEQKQFPWKSEATDSEDRELIVLVARKKSKEVVADQKN